MAQPIASRPIKSRSPLFAAVPGGAFSRSGLALPREFGQLYPAYCLLGFVIIEFACQMGLLSDIVAKARVFIRIMAFAGSLALLLILRRPGDSHPSSKAASLALLVVGLSVFHPDTVSAWAGLATLLLYASILGPIFWVPRVRIDVRTLRQLFMLFWAYHALSALFGALQIYFPGHFQPALSSVYDDDSYIESVKIQLVDGTRVFRPMGLTDTPGGAASSGAYTVILGLAFLLDKPRRWLRLVLLVSMALGLFSLYLSQVRSMLVMLGISVVSLGIPFLLQKRMQRFFSLVLIVAGIAALGFVLAVSVGGNLVTDRLSTLTESDPGSVYYANRGLFLEYTFADVVPSYPLGTGLGRWGMISRYFGDRLGSAPPLWAEIAWTGWAYDGGALLMLFYVIALLIALRTALRVATAYDGADPSPLQNWGTVLFGYSVGVFATTFNGQPFVGTTGVDFWVLNAAAFAAYRQSRNTTPQFVEGPTRLASE